MNYCCLQIEHQLRCHVDSINYRILDFLAVSNCLFSAVFSATNTGVIFVQLQYNHHWPLGVPAQKLSLEKC